MYLIRWYSINKRFCCDSSNVIVYGGLKDIECRRINTVLVQCHGFEQRISGRDFLTLDFWGRDAFQHRKGGIRLGIHKVFCYFQLLPGRSVSVTATCCQQDCRQQDYIYKIYILLIIVHTVSCPRRSRW